MLAQVSWFTYDTVVGAAVQRWFTEQSTTFARGARSLPVTLCETTGGWFDVPTSPVPATFAVGTCTIAFQDCANATLAYAFTGGSSRGQAGSVALRRVGHAPRGCA